MYHLTASVTNTVYPYLNTSVSVVIYVADRNDNAPMIEFPVQGSDPLRVSQHAPVGHMFTRVVAVDADIGNNARLEFSIAKGDTSSNIQINYFKNVSIYVKKLKDLE